ncbi:mini-chromosome maintenance complex-binding protein [Anopheles sinensis]|uniref:Mini-chromosome maintenance complex-binding protein n=1 Tax=Anopheles sinensis TaxID=74873 RepID=A0A084WRZ2_ANOSI|nr:mini-chromosome maintenance complex-binding protein [Anopheles sinensis]
MPSKSHRRKAICSGTLLASSFCWWWMVGVFLSFRACRISSCRSKTVDSRSWTVVPVPGETTRCVRASGAGLWRFRPVQPGITPNTFSTPSVHCWYHSSEPGSIRGPVPESRSHKNSKTTSSGYSTV